MRVVRGRRGCILLDPVRVEKKKREEIDSVQAQPRKTQRERECKRTESERQYCKELS